MSNNAKSSKMTSEQKHKKLADSKANNKMTLKTKDGVQQLKKEDEFYLSPILLVGLFVTALGAGFLLPGTSTPAFEIWSIIIPGVVISIVGAVHQFKHHQQKQKNTKKVSPKTSVN